MLSDKKILLVEDYDQVIAYTKSMLVLLGFTQIVVAKHADAALLACRKTYFDLILCDYNLGQGRDGYQLFEALKAEALLKADCSFIVISGERHRQDVYGMVEFLPDDYLLKPFNYAELKRRIDRAIEVKHVLRQAYQLIAEENYADALQACDVAMQEHPKYQTYVRRLKGELLMKLGLYHSAGQLYQDVLSVRELPWAKLGLVIAKFNLEQEAEAELMLSELAQQAETKIEAMDWLSRLYLKQNKLDSALEMVRKVAEASPKNYQRQHRLAHLAVVNNQPELAVRVHARLLDAARYSIYDTADNMLNYARALVQVAQRQPAREKQLTLAKVCSFMKEVKKRFNPDSYIQDQRVIEARIDLLQGNKEQAVQKLQQSEELSLGKAPSPSGLLDRARAYFEAGDLAKSDHYMKELNSRTDSSEWYDSAVVLMYRSEQQKYSEQRDLMVDSNNAGMEAYRRGHYSEAIRYFRRAQKTMPANANIALNLLQAISQKGRLDDELIGLSHQCIDIIDNASLLAEQQLRYQKVKHSIRQSL